jgi:hypothetical protein
MTVGSFTETKNQFVADYALTCWADHAVKEVKVIQIERADRLLP